MYPTGIFEQGTPSRTMNDFSTGQFQQMNLRSPYRQSPSPAFRNYYGNIGMETPQGPMSGRGAWKKDNFNLSEMNSPLLHYAGKTDQNMPYQSMDNQMFKKN